MTRSEQARADAIADFETWYLNGYCPAFTNWDYVLTMLIDGVIYDEARRAAHDAFRAVPGLRGEK